MTTPLERFFGPLRHRLRADQRGNVTIFTAMALGILVIILMGVISLSEVALAKNRLQSACDASVLAARRAYTNPQSIARAQEIGQRFFRANFPVGAFGSNDTSIELSTAGDGEFKGKATANIPASPLKSIDIAARQIVADCAARMDMPNTDVMFALDTTDSMSWTDPGDTMPRIDAVRQAVIKFVETMEANKPPMSRVRYGFVPFSETVNVGRLLRKEWMVDRWHYQSREAADVQIDAYGRTLYYWNYASVPFDVSALKGNDPGPYMTGTEIVAPKWGDGHTDQVISWRGCIEERDTVKDMSLTRISPEAYDLDIDLVPDPNNDATRWRPYLPQLIFWRKGFHVYAPQAGWVQQPIYTNRLLDRAAPGSAVCPSPAQKLAEMTPFQVTNYVNALETDGPTYLDIPMIWAARLISPTGLFRSENEFAPNGGPISRHIIMMTDGAIATDVHHYASYGLNALDQRQVSNGTRPLLTNVIDSHFRYACNAARAKGITVWVIAYGTALTSTLSRCAGDDHAFAAINSSELIDTFQTILTRIGRLRLTR